MKDSIVISMDYAGYDIIDGTPNVQRHHIFGGTANRRLSDVSEDDAREAFRKRYGISML